MKWTPLVAIICIVTLETIALLHGINGTAMSLSFAAIAGLGGYQVKAIKDRKQ